MLRLGLWLSLSRPGRPWSPPVPMPYPALARRSCRKFFLHIFLSGRKPEKMGARLFRGAVFQGCVFQGCRPAFQGCALEKNLGKIHFSEMVEQRSDDSNLAHCDMST